MNEKINYGMIIMVPDVQDSNLFYKPKRYFMRLYSFLLMMIIVAGSGCSSSHKIPVNLFEEKLNDVKYGSYSRNVMDVYLPPNRDKSTPFAY